MSRDDPTITRTNRMPLEKVYENLASLSLFGTTKAIESDILYPSMGLGGCQATRQEPLPLLFQHGTQTGDTLCLLWKDDGSPQIREKITCC